MRAFDRKNNGPVTYLEIVYTDEDGTAYDLWMFSGNKELLRKVLDSHKDQIKPKSPMRDGQLSSVGKEKIKEVDLENTCVVCEDIKEYIL